MNESECNESKLYLVHVPSLYQRQAEDRPLAFFGKGLNAVDESVPEIFKQRAVDGFQRFYVENMKELVKS